MCKIGKFFLKLFGVLFAVNALLFVVFFFDLDGKLLYHVVEPNMNDHFNKMERPDLTGTPYGPKEPVND